MSSSHMILIIACCSLVVHSNLVFADEETREPTTAEILAHPEVKGALGAIDAWLEGVRRYTCLYSFTERARGSSQGATNRTVSPSCVSRTSREGARALAASFTILSGR
jgi:hypothetical protein